MNYDDLPPRRRTPALAHAAALLLAVVFMGPAAPPEDLRPTAPGSASQTEATDAPPDTTAPGAASQTEAADVPPDPPSTAPDLTHRISTTAGMTGAAAGADPPPGPTAGQHPSEPPWSWPLEPEPRVTRYFLPPPEPWKAGHRGVDLAAGPGRKVLSPADGVVTFAGMVAGRPVLSIGHQGGLVSSYEPVHGALPKGARVRQGQVVGTIAGPPHCSLPCLHWGVRLNGAYVNPLAYVTDRRPSVLLPLPDARHPDR